MHTVQKQENDEHICCKSKVKQVMVDDLVCDRARSITNDPVCKLQPEKQHDTKKIECCFDHLV